MNSYMRQASVPLDNVHNFFNDKHAWENAIAMYQGPDPLNNWYNYICWYKTHGHGDPENKFRETLERCLTLFEHNEYYKQDPRMVRLWLKYIEMQQNPLHFYQVLHQRGVGKHLAFFYVAWGSYYESINALKEAEAVYNLGFQEKAQPYSELQHVHGKLMYTKQMLAAQQLRIAHPNQQMQQHMPQQYYGGMNQGVVNVKQVEQISVYKTSELYQQHHQHHHLQQPPIQSQQQPQPQLQTQPQPQQLQVQHQLQAQPQIQVQQQPPQQHHVQHQPLPQHQPHAHHQPHHNVQPHSQLHHHSQPHTQHNHVQQECNIYQQQQQIITYEHPQQNTYTYQQRQEVIAHHPQEIAAPPPAAYGINVYEEVTYQQPVHQQINHETIPKHTSEPQYVYNNVHVQEQEPEPAPEPEPEQNIEDHILSIRLPEKYISYSYNNYETWRPALYLEEPEDPNRICHYKKDLVYPSGADIEYSPEELRARKYGYISNDGCDQTDFVQQQQQQNNGHYSENAVVQESLKVPQPAEQPQAQVQQQQQQQQPEQVQQYQHLQQMHLYEESPQYNLQAVTPDPNESNNYNGRVLELNASNTYNGRITNPNETSNYNGRVDEPNETTTNHYNGRVIDYDEYCESQRQNENNQIYDYEENKNYVQIESSQIRLTAKTTRDDEKQNKSIKIKFKKERPPEGDSANYSAYTIESVYQPEVSSPKTTNNAIFRKNGHNFHPYLLGHTSTPKSSSTKRSKPKIKTFTSFQNEDNTSNSCSAEETTLDPEYVRTYGNVICSNLYSDNANNSSFFSSNVLENSNCSISSAVERLNFRDASNVNSNSATLEAADVSTYQENSYFATQNDVEARKKRLEKAEEVIQRHFSKEVIDPFNSELCRAFLTKIDFPAAEDEHDNYKVINAPLPKINNTKSLNLPNDINFNIDKEVGKGSYGSVYKATDVKTGTVVALKFQKPPNTWEIYICDQVLKRVKDHTILPGVMDISTAVIAPNASLIATEFSPYGSLLDINNKIRQSTTKVMHESLVMHFSAQICKIVNELHKNQIIHADIKPDNFLLMRIPSVDSPYPSLRLIDFGCAIDMSLFPDSDKTKFRKVIQTDGFTCIEMQERRPWSYETDLFCIAGTIHVMLFGEYMQLQKRAGTWDIKQKLPRYLKKHVWTNFFGGILNIKSSEKLPNLLEFKDQFEEESNKMDSDLRQQIRTLSNILHRR